MSPAAGFTHSAMAAGVIALLVLSCGDGAVEPTPPPPAPVATTVTVNPASASFSSLGETARFTAEVRDQNGQVMAGAAVAWASSDAAVASVDASGVVTAAANGSATITATAGSVSGTAAVTVAQVVSAVAITPSVDTLLTGDTLRLAAEATDANGHAVAVAEFSWASDDTAVALVDGLGLVTGVEVGDAEVTATTAGVMGRAEFTIVARKPATVVPSATPFGPAEAGKRAADPITATVMDANGLPVAGAAYRWEADENAGWVYPPEGTTDSDGRIEATWVPGFPGTGRLVLTVGEGNSSLAVALATRSVAPAHPPHGQTTVWLDHTPRGTGYSIELTPLTEPHQSYYAAINWDGAYTGLQRGGHVFERSLIFCMFDPPGGRPTRIIRHAEDAYCTSFDHQGSGKECHLNYPWEVGTAYRFEVTEQEMDGEAR